MTSKKLETQLETKTTIMKNHELIKLFSKTKSFADVIKELNKAGLFLDLDSENIKYSYENLIYFSTLHFGDNDSTGCIAGCWFGALTGFQYYNKIIHNQLEFKIL